MTDKELKSCPFCGCEDVVFSSQMYIGASPAIRCQRCLTKGPAADTREKAIEAWNKRV